MCDLILWRHHVQWSKLRYAYMKKIMMKNHEKKVKKYIEME